MSGNNFSLRNQPSEPLEPVADWTQIESNQVASGDVGRFRAELVSDQVSEQAYAWLCRRRKDYPADADVWSFRRNGAAERRLIRTQLEAACTAFPL